MITAFAPATVANLNCGFDVLGLAIDQPGDEVSVSFNDLNEVRIVSIEGDGGKLPYEVALNTAGVAVHSLWKHLGIERGVDVVIRKKMPFGSGLGSSAASAVAGAVAANENVAPSLLGGIVLLRSYKPQIDLLTLPIPNNLYCTVVHPEVEILTKEARNILPKNVPLKDAIVQTGNLAGCNSALYQNDLALLGRSLVDVFIEPYRAPLIPDFQRVKQAALYGGALAFGISGSGPSMFALSDGAAKSEQIAVLMEKSLHKKQIDCSIFNSKVNVKGAVIL